MTTAITYTIPGARTLDQLSEPTLDGQPDEDARENCVPASLAEGLNILLKGGQNGGVQAFDGDELHDAVYGQGYTGVQSAHSYIGYCAAHGVTLSAVDGTQAALIATIHREVSAGHPVVVTMPSQWGTAPADPLHPSGYTHVGVAVGIGPSGIRVMNPWHGFMQDEDDSWWAARLCYGQVWVMRKVSSNVTTTTGVPAGWRDDGKILTAPNGITVGTGIRERVLSWPGGWPAWNVPLEEEHHLASLERFNPSLGAGTQQVFRATALEWTPTHGTIMMAVGAELQATRAALATAQTGLATAQQQATHDAAIISDQQGQISTLTQQVTALRSELDVADAQVATLQRQVAALQTQAQQMQQAQAQQQADAAAQASEAQAQAGDELARGAAHAFVSAFTAAVAAAMTATPAGSAAPAAAAAGSEVTSR